MAEYIDRKYVLNCMEDSYKNAGISAEAKAKMTRWLNKAPAADVRPVVRGKWIGNKRHQSCSECHMTYCVSDGQDGEIDMTPYHYCPNCGADMRED